MTETSQEPTSIPVLQQLENLDEEDLYFLQITALLDGNTPREELFRIMKALARTPGSGRQWQSEKAAARLRRLRGLELIDNHNRCHPEVREIIARRPLEQKTLQLCRQLIHSSFLDHQATENDPDELRARTLRNFRLALYCHDFEALQSYLPSLYQAAYDPLYRHPYAALTLYPFDADWFATLPLPLQFAALDDGITHSLEDLVETPKLDHFITSRFPADEPGNRPFILLFAHKLLFCGRLEELDRLCREHGELFTGSGFRGAIAALKGKFTEAADLFRNDLDQARSLNPEGRACFDAPIVFFYILTLGHTQTAAVWEEAAQTLNTGEEQFVYNPYTRDLFRLADTLLKLFRGHISEARKSFAALEPRPERSIFTLLKALVSYWLYGRIEPGDFSKLEKLEREFGKSFPWVALESRSLLQLSRPAGENGSATGTTAETHAGAGLRPLSPAITFEPAWRRTLAALKQLVPDPETKTTGHETAPGMRLAWFLELTPEGGLNLTPRVQKQHASRWSPGRNLALSRIYEGERLPFFTEQDERICRALRRRPENRGEDYYFDQAAAVEALAGHPHLFLQGHPEIPVAVSRGEAVIILSHNSADDTFRLRLEPDLGQLELLVTAPSPTRFIYYRNSEELKEISRLLGPGGLLLPATARTELTRTVTFLARLIPVYSDLDPQPGYSSPQSESRLFLQIFPVGNGLRFDLKVKPSGDRGPHLSPGRGCRHILTRTPGGAPLTIFRDLEKEKRHLAELCRACPSLGLKEEPDQAEISHQVDDLETCLDILHEIQTLQQDREYLEEGNWLVCEWPAGRRLSLRNPPRTAAFQIRVTPHQEWFRLEGGLKVDEHEVVELERLISNAGRGLGAFVPLRENQFVRLARDLRRRLHELSFYLNEDDGELKIHRAAVGAVAEILEDMPGVDYDTVWRTQLQRFAEAADFKPQLPHNLKTSLRSYQLEGFNWLSRLAHLGFGACLADDMGLGKTVQALTLVLSRAAAGPVLVVAPTSVCDNWLRECERFAPDLNPISFGGSRRRELVEGLKPYDLLICSYTMLQQERDLLVDREWEIIVLDEAQAIKNMNTKRSRAAMSLKGRFRLITTGTPMENHLGELWNLFNFINPGLLGTLEQFNRRFAQPIEQDKNSAARDHLRALIKPYILRRTKAQVLKELPPRTEIQLKVELSEAERNFYEAVRRQAIARLEEVSHKGPDDGRNTSIQVLAELTRLRLAACNPRLVAPESEISSAKLELFGRVVTDLTSSGHRALVFSQFVRHLDLVREYLDRQKITYRYLDGSTPKAKRRVEINAFQEGDSDLFLISLKAGGLGLNLTAADYVIHLDPWWNPAIEDQASDRAHRIGQTRPVTVYRLITRHTIEEKIVRLHQEKRNLADQILTASDQSARFSTGELLELIKEGV